MILFQSLILQEMAHISPFLFSLFFLIQFQQAYQMRFLASSQIPSITSQSTLAAVLSLVFSSIISFIDSIRFLSGRFESFGQFVVLIYILVRLPLQNYQIDRRNMEKANLSKGANYKYAQIFGYKGPNQKIMEEDIISVISFDDSGKYISLGDRAGRIIIFENPESTKKKDEQFEYFSEFQSHTRQFDPLRSIDVEEEITGIEWMRHQGRYMKMLTTNSRNIKLWKIFQKTEKKVVKSAGKELNMPKMQNVDSGYTAVLQKPFPNKHLASINSISSSSNEEYLLSSDDVQTFMWSMENPDKPFLVADLLGNQKIEEVKENINFSKMHPSSDNMFLFGTNKGTLKMCDLRVSAQTDTTAVSFKNESGNSGQKNFFTQMISSYSSGDFIKSGKYVVSRDFLTVKIWDICNSKKPVNTITIQQGIKNKLCQMFENDCIFDKFSISSSMDSSTILTGNYNNCFHLVDVADGTNTQYELNYKKTTVSRQIIPGKVAPIQKMDYARKTTACDFNPKRNLVAVASLNCFYIYSM